MKMNGGKNMINVDIYSIQGKSVEDNKIILATHKKGIGMTIDQYGRIFNEGGQYIADGEIVESGFGIGCRTHGGRRPGAGRKPSGKRNRMIYVTDAEYEQVKSFIADLRIKNR